MALLVSSLEGGNFRLSLADGGELFVEAINAVPGGVSAVTATLPLTSSGGGTPNIAVSGIAGTTHAVVVSEGSGSAFAFVGPSSSVGAPLVSAGASADPVFGSVAPAFLTPTTWVEHAAGDLVNVAGQQAPQFFSIDTSAVSTASQFLFPVHGTAVDGQEVTIVLEGAAVNTNVQLNPGASNLMGDPNAAGQYGTSAQTLTAVTVGQVIKRKYKDEGASGKWRPF